MKTIDENLLTQFEAALDPKNIEKSVVSAQVLGFGEISSIFMLEKEPGIAFKRMPLFSSTSQAEKYAGQYTTYCMKLREAGLCIPEDKTIIISLPKRPVVLYIAQVRLKSEAFAHKQLHLAEQEKVMHLIENIIENIVIVWHFNKKHAPHFELSLDGQLSNWVEDKDKLWFVDTSTPLFRIDGQEQLDPNLLLQSAPGFLRWILRLFFLEDVMNRYYDLRQVFIDLAANLYKEQRPDLIPVVLEHVNKHLPENEKPVSAKEVEKYYRGDKMIWALFLTFRKIDRWIKTVLCNKRYEFILPGKIKR